MIKKILGTAHERTHLYRDNDHNCFDHFKWYLRTFRNCNYNIPENETAEDE